MSVVNPIKELGSRIIDGIFTNKTFETRVPLEDGYLFWKRRFIIQPGQPAYNDLVRELSDKGFEVIYRPYKELPGDFMHGYYPECTYLKVRPSQYQKTQIIIDNDPF